MWRAGKYDASADIDMALLNWDQLRSARAERKASQHNREQEALEHFRSQHGGRTPMQVFCHEEAQLLRKMEMAFVDTRRSRFRQQVDKAALAQAAALGTIGRTK
jgi:hypothetical protein